MFNTIGLATMFLTPHAALVTPPAPVAVVAPALAVVTPKPPTPPVVSAPPPVQTIQQSTANPGGPGRFVPTTQPSGTVQYGNADPTTGTTTYVGLECVVTLPGAGGAGTFSPGPAVNGSCAQYQAQYPTAAVVAEPVTSTYTDGDQ